MRQAHELMRKRLFLEKDGLSGFRELVYTDFTVAWNPIAEHIHRDAIELCYISKGSQVYAVDGRRYRVGAGMVFITYANELHSTDMLTQEKDVHLYHMIIDTVNDLSHFMGLNGEEGVRLAHHFNSLNRCFYVGMDFKARLDELFRLHTEQPPMYQLLMRSHVCLMADELSRASSLSQPSLTQDIHDVLTYIEDHLYGPPPTTAELAAFIRLSVPHFKQKFRRQLGIPPIAYQLHRRIDLSCDLLCEGRSITQIAYDLGFSSSQHFSNTFRKHMGESPSQWKRR